MLHLGYVFPIAFEIADLYLWMMQIYIYDALFTQQSVNYYFEGTLITRKGTHITQKMISYMVGHQRLLQ